eukprot:TRINITY_DN2636_c0_g1_i6.p1 TRINITY_DN2636_c0_g1~~TRINITY_DN2636_c0_g1_i6.p1  ORF type:complete len:1246 (-),score=306.59 TRINITY_DN2636_c0_g1_i6:186-3923(-)
MLATSDWYRFVQEQLESSSLHSSVVAGRLMFLFWLTLKLFIASVAWWSGNLASMLPMWVASGVSVGSAFVVAEYCKVWTIVGIFFAAYPVLSTFRMSLERGGYQIMAFNFTYIFPSMAAMCSGPVVSILAEAATVICYLIIWQMHWVEHPFPVWQDPETFRLMQLGSWSVSMLFYALVFPVYDRLRNEPMYSLEKAQQKLQLSITNLSSETKQLQTDVSTYSHEIRTSLNVIATMADSLSEAQSSTAALPEVLLLQTAAKSLITLSNNVLDVSAAEVAALRIENAIFDIDALVQKLVASMQFAALQRGPRLQLVMPSRSLPLVRGDASRVQQVLYNLLSNAVQYSARGDVIVCVTHAAGHAPDDVILNVTVSDCGAGIGADVDLFQRVRTNGSKHTRTMLGLYITRKLVQRMGGRISVCSKANRQGTIVRVSVPFTRVEPVKPTDADATPLTILYADDEPANLFVLRTLLRQTPHKLVTVADGLEAVETFNSLHPNVVLLDIEMPNCNGIEAMQRIRAAEHASAIPRTPIAFITAHASPEFASLDCDTVLPKPITRAALLQYLLSVVQRQSQQQLQPLVAPLPLSVARVDTTESELQRIAAQPTALQRVLKFKYSVMCVFCVTQAVLYLLSLESARMFSVRRCVDVAVAASYLVYPLLMRKFPHSPLLTVYTIVQQLFKLWVIVHGRFGFEAVQFCSIFSPLLITVLDGSVTSALTSAVIVCTAAWSLGLTMPVRPVFSGTALRDFTTLLTVNNVVLTLLFSIYFLISSHARKGSLNAMAETATATERVQKKTLSKKLAAERFAESVMYDFRTPLRIVEGISHMLSVKKDMASDVVRNMKVLRSACQLLLNVLQNVSDTQMMRNSEMLPRSATVLNIQQFTDEAQRALEFHATSKGVTIRVVIGPRVPNLVIGDPARATQTTINMLRCAIRVAAGHGRVTLHLVNVNDRSPAFSNDESLQTAVSFQSQGAMLLRMLVTVEGGDVPVVADLKPLEAPLLVCKEIVEQLGGSFLAPRGRDSSLWYCATFPVCPAHVMKCDNATEARPLRVLSINDSIEIQFMLRLFLQDSSHRFTAILSQADAVRALTSFTYDLVLISDLPDITACELLQHVRRLLSSAAVDSMQFVMCTGAATSSIHDAALLAGFNMIESAPLTHARLLDLIAVTAATVTTHTVTRSSRSSSSDETAQFERTSVDTLHAHSALLDAASDEREGRAVGVEAEYHRSVRNVLRKRTVARTVAADDPVV